MISISKFRKHLSDFKSVQELAVNFTALQTKWRKNVNLSRVREMGCAFCLTILLTAETDPCKAISQPFYSSGRK